MYYQDFLSRLMEQIPSFRSYFLTIPNVVPLVVRMRKGGFHTPCKNALLLLTYCEFLNEVPTCR